MPGTRKASPGNDKVNELKEKLTSEKKKVEVIDWKKGLSTGSTLLNLACTGRTSVGYFPGQYYSFVGASESGKTWIALTSIAEASINKEFDSYRFIYDNPERRSVMDLKRYFGERAAQRLEPPRREGKEDIHSTTVEEFYDHLDDAVKEERPFLYVLDSMDSVSTDQANLKYQEQKKARRRGKEAPGSYGDGKARINSDSLRRVVPKLAKSGSILIIIGQERDSLNSMSYGNAKSQSGGRALKFYAMLQFWTSIKKELVKEVKEKKRQIGIITQVKITKNNVNGQHHKIDVPIYHSHGIDDIGSMVDYLVEEGHWSKGAGGVTAKEFDVKLPQEKLIQHLENNNLEKQLRLLVSEVWTNILDSCVIERKKKYE
jgi:RecA/RadA recombinase